MLCPSYTYPINTAHWLGAMSLQRLRPDKRQACKYKWPLLDTKCWRTFHFSLCEGIAYIHIVLTHAAHRYQYHSPVNNVHLIWTACKLKLKTSAGPLCNNEQKFGLHTWGCKKALIGRYSNRTSITHIFKQLDNSLKTNRYLMGSLHGCVSPSFRPSSRLAVSLYGLPTSHGRSTDHFGLLKLHHT